jgi:hypothetical protein
MFSKKPLHLQEIKGMFRMGAPDEWELTYGQCNALDGYLEAMKRWASRSEFMAPGSGASMLEVQSFVNEVDRITPHAMLAMLSSDKEGVLTGQNPKESCLFSMFHRCMELRRYSERLARRLNQEISV